MIQFNNKNDWKIIQYQGHSIKAVYSNLGKVWEKESPVPPTPTFDGKFKLTLNDSSVVTAQCDSTSAVTMQEVSSIYKNTVVTCEFGDCVTSIGNSAFIDCKYLTSVYIPSGITSIGTYAFYYCTSLTSCTLSTSITTISDAIFGRTNITSIDIPESVTSIGNSAFNGCGALTSVTIPSGVTSIGTYAFSWCSALTSITVNATTPPTLGNNVYDGSTCPIYVPSASVNAYKTATNWSTYANRIQAIPNS